MKQVIRGFLARRRDRRRKARFDGKDPKSVFQSIYLKNTWGDSESASGKGSNLEQTEIIRQELPKILSKYDIRSMLDLPCGDFYWMSQTQLGATNYIGADIVPEMIENNSARHASDNVSFQVLNVIEDTLPKVDLLFCRDCLVHLSLDNVQKALMNIRQSGIEYILTTTFPETDQNKDIVTGQWRSINLKLAPFGFPDPLETILEETPGRKGAFADKTMALWRVADLP